MVVSNKWSVFSELAGVNVSVFIHRLIVVAGIFIAEWRRSTRQRSSISEYSKRLSVSMPQKQNSLGGTQSLIARGIDGEGVNGRAEASPWNDKMGFKKSLFSQKEYEI